MANTNGIGSGALESRATPVIGVLEWFRPGEEARVEDALEAMRKIKVTHARTIISWLDWYTLRGKAWYAWLLPRLAREVEVIPRFIYTPRPQQSQAQKLTVAQELRQYTRFVEQAASTLAGAYESIEFAARPHTVNGWTWHDSAQWAAFADMLGSQTYLAKMRGHRTVLGTVDLSEMLWFQMLCERGVLAHVDVVGVDGSTLRSESQTDGWAFRVEAVRQRLNEHGSNAGIWITDAGYSTARHDEYAQLQHFVEAVHAPVERVYWHGLKDRTDDGSALDAENADERAGRTGLLHGDGRPKLLYRLWADAGLQGVLSEYGQGQVERLSRQAAHRKQRGYVLITGGAGFVGTNLATRYLDSGHRVMVYDNLSRPGVEQNLAWLRERYGDRLIVEIADVRDRQRVTGAVRHASAVFHLAAQVAVTTSLNDPVADFEINARGTLNLLEALRLRGDDIPMVFTSTNKVYGNLPDVIVMERATRYEPCDDLIDAYGISEEQPADFHSPYGASKGAADHYVLDYARTFGLPAAVLRMSCIYGPHQFGTEDQGWVAHFLLSALRGQPITIYGDGKQVRDILFVSDLVDAFVRIHRSMPQIAGRAYNIGGGPRNATSLIELLRLIEHIHGSMPELTFATTRTGDQRYYVSDTRRLFEDAGWRPQVDLVDGVTTLYRWLRERQANGTIAAAPVQAVHSPRPAAQAAGAANRQPQSIHLASMLPRHRAIDRKEGR